MARGFGAEVARQVLVIVAASLVAALIVHYAPVIGDAVGVKRCKCQG